MGNQQDFIYNIYEEIIKHKKIKFILWIAVQIYQYECRMIKNKYINFLNNVNQNNIK